MRSYVIHRETLQEITYDKFFNELRFFLTHKNYSYYCGNENMLKEFRKRSYYA